MRLVCSFSLLTCAVAAQAQPTIQTLFGGPPNGLPALSASMNSPSAVISDGHGAVIAGLKGGHLIVSISKDGIVTVIAGTGINGNTGDGGPATSANIGQPSGFAYDQAGNLYFADAGNNNIRRINSTDGTITTIAGTGKATYSGDNGPAVKAALNQPTEIVFDANGNLLIADTFNHAIRMITPDGTIKLVAGSGNGNPSAGGDGSPASMAGLTYPFGVALDSVGNIYISDTGNQKIRVITTDGLINRYAGRGQAGFGGDNSDPLNAYFYNPTTLAVDSADQLYINDQSNVRIRRIQNDGRIVSVAGTGILGAEGDGGLAKSANIVPVSIALDTQNNLLIADGTNNRVREVTIADGIINTIAGSGIASYDPRYLFRKGDSVYFSDSNAQKIRVFQLSTGALSVAAGSGIVGYSGDGSSAFSAYMKNPRGITMDAAGNLYFADSGNHVIRKVDTSSNISTFAGTAGTATSTGDGGAATSATLNEPVDLTFDGLGNLYIAERSGHRVRKIAKDLTVSTVAGTGLGGPPDSETGNGTDQRLNLPQGLFVEPDNSVLISDSGNNRVRRLKTDGTIATIAGTGNSGFDGDGGQATSASLNGPIGVTEDSAGNIYINDSNNNALRQIGSDGIIATVAGLSAPGSSRTGGYNGDGSPATSLLLNKPVGLVTSTAACSVLLADTGNQRLRQVSAGVSFAITTNPAGQQVTVDGQTPITTPTTVSFLPGTQHTIDVPAVQDNGSGTRYLGTGSIAAGSDCSAPRQSLTVNLKMQFSLTITPDPGGAVVLPDASTPASWLDSGSQLTLTAAPIDGFVFTGWEGDCSGMDACQITFDQPKNVIAHFQPNS